MTEDDFKPLPEPDPAFAPRNPLQGAPVPPSPDELAMRFAAALMANPKYAENPGAAIGAAWAIVPQFYMDRLQYATKIAPMFFTVDGQSTDDTYNGEVFQGLDPDWSAQGKELYPDVFVAGGDEHPGIAVRQIQAEPLPGEGTYERGKIIPPNISGTDA